MLVGTLLLVLLTAGIAVWRVVHTPAADAPPAGSGGTVYTVVAGDTLSAIARRYGVSVQTLMARNGLTNPDLVVVGARLRIPGVAAPAGVPSVQPEVQRLIVAAAQRNGLSPAFALAVAWQESGFNQRMVSRTGAIGVMQVEPATADVVAGLLGRPVHLAATDDNIAVGVYWLARLVTSYGGNEELAAAAYYQGARSIARDGLYPETRQYVADVRALEGRFGGSE